MSLVYEEFPSDLPPSMSDEEIEVLKANFKKKKCTFVENARKKVQAFMEDDVNLENEEN